MSDTTERPALMWFRRDLRLADNPALVEAGRVGPVLPVIILDPRLLGAGGRRAERYLASVAALRDSTDGALLIRQGDPAAELPRIAAEVRAAKVCVTGETTPYGRRRDRRVAAELARQDAELIKVGSPYAVGPGRVLNRSGSPYRVFTPFHRAWLEHGWAAPAEQPDPSWFRWHREPDPVPLPDPDDHDAGERAARDRWRRYRTGLLRRYADERDRPDLDSTSRMSVPLKYGELHPRTLLADLADPAPAAAKAVETYVRELCWREFYADVLWHQPWSAWRDLRDDLTGLEYADPGRAAEVIEAWKAGRTGYPVVDAAMRQLLAEGWMHNRMRMVTASFLIKDLHVWWPVGARHFLDRLADGDLASNNLNWQWVAGTGTDPAPYFRVFNPVTQGRKFDPDGDYVRRWVPELAHLSGAAVHEPWRVDDGYAEGYPERIVDHAEERRIALARYEQAR